MKRERRNAQIKDPQGYSKTVKITGCGKLRRRKQRRSHLRRRKSKRVKRQFKKDLEVHPSDVQRIERLLGKRFR
jgi:ribosomal protein L35